MSYYDTSHLVALYERLARDKSRVLTAGRDKALREVWVAQTEREIEKEIEFLTARGVVIHTADSDMTDDELLKELMG